MRRIGPVTAVLGFLIPQVLRALSWTWRVRRLGEEPVVEAQAAGPVVVALLHGEQLPFVALHAGRGWVAITSRSADGELVAGTVRRLGFEVIRGSSRHGGAEALQAAAEAVTGGRSPIFAVDGPRGPRLQVQPGAAVLSARTGRPLVLTGITARPALRLRTWDRFLVPLPFARVEVRYEVLPPTPPVREAIADRIRCVGERLHCLGDPDGEP